MSILKILCEPIKCYWRKKRNVFERILNEYPKSSQYTLVYILGGISGEMDPFLPQPQAWIVTLGKSFTLPPICAMAVKNKPHRFMVRFYFINDQDNLKYEEANTTVITFRYEKLFLELFYLSLSFFLIILLLMVGLPLLYTRCTSFLVKLANLSELCK